MKTLIATLCIVMVANTATAGNAYVSPDEVKGICEGLYHLGWDNFSFGMKVDYVLICKPLGWA